MATCLIKHGYFWTLALQTADKKLDYIEDVKNCAKEEELAVLKNVGSLLFEYIWSLIFTFNCAHEQKFSSSITLFKICEQYLKSRHDFVYIDRKGYERDSDFWNSYELK